MEELDDMFIKGQYTPFSDQPSNKKHPLTDSTNAQTAKKRKIQQTTSEWHTQCTHAWIVHVHVLNYQEITK